jgi:hypothetical protein
MNRKLLILIFWIAGFLLGVAAYLVVTNLPSGSPHPINTVAPLETLSDQLGVSSGGPFWTRWFNYCTVHRCDPFPALTTYVRCRLPLRILSSTSAAHHRKSCHRLWRRHSFEQFPSKYPCSNSFADSNGGSGVSCSNPAKA